MFLTLVQKIVQNLKSLSIIKQIYI